MKFCMNSGQTCSRQSVDVLIRLRSRCSSRRPQAHRPSPPPALPIPEQYRSSPHLSGWVKRHLQAARAAIPAPRTPGLDGSPHRTLTASSPAPACAPPIAPPPHTGSFRCCHAAIRPVVAKPAHLAHSRIVIRQLQCRDMARHAIHQQPRPALPHPVALLVPRRLLTRQGVVQPQHPPHHKAAVGYIMGVAGRPFLHQAIYNQCADLQCALHPRPHPPDRLPSSKARASPRPEPHCVSFAEWLESPAPRPSSPQSAPPP